MERARFKQMLQAYPKIRENLQATARSRHLARAHPFDWLGADEVIYFISRKHEFFLFLGLILPILLGVGALPVLAFGLSGVASSFFLTAATFVGAFFLIAAVGWGIWNYIDWGNDYYIVTSQRVIWVEKIIGLYESRREAPLDTILAVNVISSQLGRMLNYGNINVRTFTGGILMRHANEPLRFASFVEGFKQRVIQISKEEEARAMEQALEQALTKSVLMLDKEHPQVPETPPPIHPPRIEQKKQESFREQLDRMFKVRYEKDGMITYRKHWFILLGRVWQPLTSLLIWFLVVFFLVYLQIYQGFALFSWPVIIALAFLSFVPLFAWLVYQYLDWSNDIYRLTREQILDIERKPLGQETKKTAPLESILSIEHERENLLGIILNYGVVTINVGETKFIFHGVYNPDQVHSDIADYREALNRRKRDKEAAREQQRMVNWLVTFQQQTERLEDIENKGEAE
jgi:uncharacterized membrane protein YdbT with pleckstrin-like domain